MLEKLFEILERIAVALERSAAYANTAPKTVVNNTAVDKAPAGKTKEDGPVKRVNGKVVEPASALEGDGLGDEPEAITFEQMRDKLVAVKQHTKLGKTKSDALLAKYGKLPDIKESDYPKLVAEADKLLKSVA